MYFALKSFKGQRMTRLEIIRWIYMQTRHLQTCKFMSITQIWSRRMSACFLDIEISAPKGILFFPSARLPKTKAKLKMLDSVNSQTSKVTNLFLQNYFLKTFSIACSWFCDKVPDFCFRCNALDVWWILSANRVSNIMKWGLHVSTQAAGETAEPIFSFSFAIIDH